MDRIEKKTMGKDKVVVIPVKLEELEEAYRGLLEMIKVFPPICKRVNLDGMGDEDARNCKNHLQIAANACLTLIAMMDNMIAAERRQGSNGTH